MTITIGILIITNHYDGIIAFSCYHEHYHFHDRYCHH